MRAWARGERTNAHPRHPVDAQVADVGAPARQQVGILDTGDAVTKK